MGVLQGWHRGERAIQRKLGFDGPMSTAYTWIEGEMPEEHRIFHTSRLPFVPVTTLDAGGRPWTSIFAAQSGEPGFVSSPAWDRLSMSIRSWAGDPFNGNVKLFDGQKMLTAGIGIEFSTRRRNKFAGHIFDIQKKENNVYDLQMIVNQAIGNCPKYINLRELDPYPGSSPVLVHDRPHLGSEERLPDEAVRLIRAADTVFIGTTYVAEKNEESRFPSHVGQNQRGGRSGFVRVKPSDERTVVLPDYSGNRLLTSLGNIEATPLAGLTFVDFKTGDVLYLTGNARTLVGPEAQTIMPLQNVLSEVYVTGYVFVRDALPVRQRPGISPVRSPYSPPVRVLAEETAEGSSSFFDRDSAVTLRRVQLHSHDLATFSWATVKPISIVPGQTAILDFSDLVGTRQYSHMAPMNPTSVNDDRIRTWTVSSADLSPGGTRTFDLTMREKPGGMITGTLFTVARKLSQLRPEMLEDTRPLNLQVKLAGIAGSFTLSRLPQPLQGQQATTFGYNKSMLWLAGGIGVTPFISMLTAIARSDLGSCAGGGDDSWDVVLALSTREPDVLVPLLTNILKSDHPPKLRLGLHVFSQAVVPTLRSDLQSPNGELSVTLIPHSGHVEGPFLDSIKDINSRKVYLCGPEMFERAMLEMLDAHGVSADKVVRESFEY